MILAVIPARGGSRRIPKKNIKEFAGKPMLAHSILAARASGLFDKIVVSTDSEEIAEVAKQFGADIPFLRPANLADDYTGTNDVVAHAIRHYRDQGITVDTVCCIYATAPFVTAENLCKGYELLNKSGKTFVFSATSFPFPIFRAIELEVDQTVKMVWPEHLNSRSQDLPETYHDAGQFYWGKPDGFLDQIPMFSEQAAALVIPRHLVQDIDTMEDWQRAELMYKALQLAATENSPSTPSNP